MNKKRAKFYLTKYALTSGVGLKECDEPDLDGYLFTGWTSLNKSCWARTWEEAQKQAEALRVKKISSLKKQLAKLEKMTFAEPK